MSNISELSSISPEATIGNDVTIGPFCVIGPDVTLGEGCELFNHVTITGNTTIGCNNVFYPNCVIGIAPQDLKYKGTPTETFIGNNNVFRENVTVHRGTEIAGGITKIGNNNLLMVGCHIAHDCTLGNYILLGNLTCLAGHVIIEDYAVVSAMVGVHHFVSIGKFSYIGGMTPVRRDVPPFMKVSGDPQEVICVNAEGLRRNGFEPYEISGLKEAHRALYRSKGETLLLTMQQRLHQLKINNDICQHVAHLCRFVSLSCASQFSRGQEAARQDKNEDRIRKDSFEIRSKIV
jgi:UDP-N-acetylglucosamine acyltransferase